MAMLLNRMIEDAALRRPDAPAIRCDGSTLTYEQLADRANGLARVLIEGGLRRRDRVAVLVGKGENVPVSFYGALTSGAALVPIDPKSPVEQVARILRATGATALVSEPGRRRVAAQALASCPEVSHVVGFELEDEAPYRCTPWSVVLDETGGPSPQVDVIDLDPAYILHTSGSTGIPKLIQHTHRSAMSFVEWAVQEYSLTQDDRLSNHSSHHTCFATFDYYAAARAGATTVILPPAALMMPGSLSALLEKERLTVWYSVPTALVHLSLRGELETRDLRSIRWVLFAGETFPEKHLRRLMTQLPDARFSHVYGSTETNVCTFYNLSPSGRLSGQLPIGKACSNSCVRVVDETMTDVPDGGLGELLIRGSSVMSGYWDDRERNREVLVPITEAGGFEEVYFRTGDRVRVLDDGNLVFGGRADYQVKVRGHRVELEEIENALLELDPVEEAAAYAVPDGEGSSALMSAVVLASGSGWTEREIVSGLKKRLPLYAIPADISILGSLPRTPTGKVDRKALRNLIAAQKGRDID